MKSMFIRLNTIGDVKEFLNTVTRFDFEVDLISGRYAVDAKSIMAIFSLDMSQPIRMDAYSEDCGELFAAVRKFSAEPQG